MLRPLRWMVLMAAVCLAACGGGGGSSASTGSSTSSSSSSSGGANAVQLVVGPGPTQSSSYFNIPTTTVTVCVAGTSTCKNIDHVLVDTGSYGLRLLASQLSGLALQKQADPVVVTNVIEECLPFADGYAWGPVATADLKIGGEVASNLPMQIIDDSSTPTPAAPSSCTKNGKLPNIGTQDQLGANGVLGVGLFTTDCGGYCAAPAASQTLGFVYYSCGSSVCNGAQEAEGSQVVNPVSLFATDNNGAILQLPGVTTAGAASDTGLLTFGIGTQSNNHLNGATVLTTDSQGYIITTYKGQMLSSSFLDSGSNGFYFPDSSIPPCTGFTNASQFYCPSSTQTLSATNQGQNGNMTPIQFTIANLNDLIKSSSSNFALDDVGGPATPINGSSNYFDFGVPFFYGRKVFTAIEGSPADGTTGPYVAY